MVRAKDAAPPVQRIPVQVAGFLVAAKLAKVRGEIARCRESLRVVGT
jgi:hypothetical protein